MLSDKTIAIIEDLKKRELSLTDIGIKYCVSRQRISQIYHEQIEKGNITQISIQEQRIIDTYIKLRAQNTVISCDAIAKELYEKATNSKIESVKNGISNMIANGIWTFGSIPRTIKNESENKVAIKKLLKETNPTLTEIAKKLNLTLTYIKIIYREERKKDSSIIIWKQGGRNDQRTV